MLMDKNGKYAKNQIKFELKPKKKICETTDDKNFKRFCLHAQEVKSIVNELSRQGKGVPRIRYVLFTDVKERKMTWSKMKQKWLRRLSVTLQC